MKGLQLPYVGLELVGKDAKDFAQRLTTVNFQRLRPGLATRGLLLNAGAKVLASFIVFAFSSERFVFLGSSLEIQTLSKEFEKLHFGEKLSFGSVPAFVYASQEEAASSWQEFVSFSEKEGMVFFPWIWGGTAFWSVAQLPDFMAEDMALWEKRRLQSLTPALGKEWTAGESNALDVGFFPWVHEGKGCYPGQEVVERSLRVGHPAKALLQLQIPKQAQVGDQLLVEQANVGKLTSVADDIALAIVSWKAHEQKKFLVVRGTETIGEAQCPK